MSIDIHTRIFSVMKLGSKLDFLTSSLFYFTTPNSLFLYRSSLTVYTYPRNRKGKQKCTHMFYHTILVKSSLSCCLSFFFFSLSLYRYLFTSIQEAHTKYTYGPSTIFLNVFIDYYLVRSSSSFFFSSFYTC